MSGQLLEIYQQGVSRSSVRKLMHIAIQTMIVHTLSKYRVDIASLSEVRSPHFRSGVIMPASSQSCWLYHCGILIIQDEMA